MNMNVDSKSRNRRSIFGRVSVSLTVPMLLASNLTSAALADNNRATEWQQFQLNNPALEGKELKQSFKDHWQDIREARKFDAASNAAEHAINNDVTNAISNINAVNAGRLNANDFATKAEFKAYKESFKQQNISDQIKQSVQHLDNNQMLKVNGGFNLDLTSAVETITLGSNLFRDQASVSINVGGENKTVQAGSKVTAAEYVAAKQALVSGGQTVTLDSDGRATGGSVDLSAMTAGNQKMKVEDLVVPVSVTASGDFGKGGDVRIKGDLVNSGSINAYSSTGNVNAIIRADNITNNSGADITSTVSDLTLQADKYLSNFGTINATGNLTVVGERSVTNSGSVIADGNLNIQAPKVTNSGALASTYASVNVGTTVDNDVVVNNYGGSISALNGAINLRDSAYVAEHDTIVVGGDLFSEELNLYTGGGTSDVYVNELTGVVSTTGTAAHVSANTGTLSIGEQCLTGDPTYFNTGNINILGNIVVGEDLAIIAGQNITFSTPNPVTIQARDASGNGCDIVMVAGANVSGTGSQTPTNLPAQSPGNISGNALSASFSGASATGGNISLGFAQLVNIDSSGSGTNTSAGDITLAAYSNGSTGGNINLGPSFGSITAKGNGTGANGAITVVGESNSVIQNILPDIDNTGGAIAADIILAGARPAFDTGTLMTFNEHGSVTSGNKIIPGVTSTFGIQADSVKSSGGIYVRGGDRVAFTTLEARGNDVKIEAPLMFIGEINVSSSQAGQDAGRVELLSSNEVRVQILNLSSMSGGNAGTLIATTNSTNTLNLNGAVGTNHIATVLTNAAIGGDGATVDATNLGTGGIRVVNAILAFAGATGNAGSLRFNAPTGTLDLTSYGSGINLSGSGLNGGNGGTVSLTYGSLTVNAGSNPFSVSVNAGFNGVAGTIDIRRTGTGTISLGSSAGDLDLSATGPGGTINASAGGLLSVSGSGVSAENINLESGTGGAFGMNLAGAFSGTDLSLHSTSSIFNFSGTTLNFAGNLSLVTNQVNFNGATYTAQKISISSLDAAGSDLALDAGGTAALNASSINIGAADILAFSGTFAYNGSTILSGQSIAATGSTQSMQNGVTGYIVTPNLVGGTFNGDWISTTTPLSGISVVNNPGSVVFSGDIIIAGDFAVVAAGDVDLTGANINLSGPTAGSLSIFAGYDSSLVTNGTQTVTTQTINNLTPSAGGGSVIGGADIDVRGTGSGGVAGSVTVVARGGSIDVGDIQAGGDVNNGRVMLIGETGVTVGDINTTSNSGSGGAVTIAVGQAELQSVSITNGALSGTVAPNSTSAGDINAGTITTSNKLVILRGGATASDRIDVESVNSGTQGVSVQMLGGSADLGSGNVARLGGLGSGSVKLINSGDLEVGAAATWDLDVTSTAGSLTFTGGNFTGLRASSFGNLSLDDFGGFPHVTGNAYLETTGSAGDIVGSITVSGSLTLDSAHDIGTGLGSSALATNAGSIDAYAANNAFLSLTNSAVNFTGGGAGNFFSIGSTAPNAVLTTGPNGINATTIAFQTTAATSIGASSDYFKVNNNGGSVNVQLNSQNGSADQIDVFLEYAGSSTFVYTTAAGRNTSLRTPNASAGVQLNSTILSVAGTLDITTNYLSIDSIIRADGNISVQSNAGQGLTVESLTPTSTIESGGLTAIRANSGTLTLKGAQLSYLSSVDLFGETVDVQSTQVAQQPSRIFTGNLIISGVGALVTYNDPPQPGDTWTLINGGTYANGTGNITLTGPLTFGDLAIIAAGNITINGDIDLSGVSGGDLTMLAGYNFTPSPDGTTFNPIGTYTNFTPNAIGGSITVSGSINTSATASDAGRVYAVANNGTISLQNIDTTSTGGNAGEVLLIGGNGVSANNINTGGADVTMAVADAVLFPEGSTPFQIVDGRIVGDIGLGSLRTGVIEVHDVNVGTTQFATATFSTAGDGDVNISGLVTANQIRIGTGDLSIDSGLFATAGTGGGMRIEVNTATTSANGPLTFQSRGLNNDRGGSIEFEQFSTAAVTLGSSGQFVFDVGSEGSGEGGILQIRFGGDVTVSSGAVVAAGTGNTSVAIGADGNLAVNAGAFNLRNQNGSGSGIGLNAGQDGSGNLILNDISFFEQANGNGANSSGGNLAFNAVDIILPAGVGNSATNALVLTAYGTGNGNGGNVVFNTQSTRPLFIGAPAKAPKGAALFLEVDAHAGQALGSDGESGSARIRTGGDFTISDTSLIDLSRGENGTRGATYDLGAGVGDGKGELIINGSLSTNGNGPIGGDIILSSDSKTAFVVNGANPRNGISGTLDASDGFIQITNNSGGVTIQTDAALTADSMRFSMGAKGTLVTGTNVTLNAIDFLRITTAGGSIGSTSAPLNVVTRELQANTSAKGSVNINNGLIGPDSFVRGSAGGSFNVTAAGTVRVSDISTTKGSIKIVTTGGDLIVDAGSTVTANNGALTLNNTNVGGQIQIGDGATVETQQKGKNTILAVGAIPSSGTNPITSDGTYNNINVNVEGKKGIVYFGGPPNAVVSATSAFVNGINKSVIFSGPAGSIVLGDGATVTADPPSPSAAAMSFAASAMSATNGSGSANGNFNSINQLFGFVGESSTVTSDLSVLNLNASPQMQSASNSSLLTAAQDVNARTNTVANAILQNSQGINAPGVYNATLQSSLPAGDDDNSFVVGNMGRGGVIEAAICSDSEFVGKNLGKLMGIKTVGHSERVSIKSGTVLFVPLKPTTVETPNGIVHIDAKSVALVSTSAAGLAVYDLDDQHKGSVRVESNGHDVVLSPGRHVMITKHHTSEFAQINAVETISHRNVQSAMKNGHKAHTSEFSVLSALDTIVPLKALASSKHADAKQVTDRMIKTTAVMLHLSSGGGQYQHYFKPRLTAYGQ